MFNSPAEILSILIHYKYFVIFPIAIVEGPIIIVISGLLVSVGILNGWVACIVLSVADTIGDSLYYLVGKYWKNSVRIKKYAKFFGYSEKSEEFLENHFRKHKVKTFLIAKISHGIGGSVQIASGIAGVSYKEFLTYSVIGTVPKTIILMIIGFYLGESYEKIDGVLHYVALTVIAVVVISLMYVVSGKVAKSFFRREEASENSVDSKN